MTAMTDRDRAVAEKLGWRETKGYAELWELPESKSRRSAGQMRFCSNATWETEGMVLEYLRTGNAPVTDFIESLAENLGLEIRMPTAQTIEYWFWSAGVGDLANALADVLEAEDASSKPE